MISVKIFRDNGGLRYQIERRITRDSRNLGATMLLFKILLLCSMPVTIVQARAGVTEPDPRAQST